MRQAPSGQRINTDSCTFAALIGDGLNPKKIIDIGAGTGVVSLMLAARFPGALITAVEPEPLIASVAVENFRNSPWHSQINLVCDKVQNIKLSNAESDIGFFDFVVCNPPYFHNSMLSSDPLRQVARHTTTLDPRELFASITRLMTQSGAAWISCPFSALRDWVGWGNDAGLHVIDRIDVGDHPKATPHISVLGWARDPIHGSKIRFVSYRESPQGAQSDWMKEFRRVWYPGRFNKD